MNQPPKSSSNRSPSVCDAEIHQGDQFSGPLRLPENRAEDFIADFNRIYSGLDLHLEPRFADEADEGKADNVGRSDKAAESERTTDGK